MPKQICRAAVNYMTAAKAEKRIAGNGSVKEPQISVVRHEAAILSLEKRIQRVAELNIVIEKWRKLQESKKKLTEFQLGNDEHSSSILLKDSSGTEFRTNHSLVVSTMLETVRNVLDAKIAEVEEQINFSA